MKLIKKIDLSRLPEILTPEIITILVEMAIEFPKKNDDWEKISNILLERNQLNLILDIVEKYKNEEREKKWNSLSVDYQNEELKKREESLKDKKFSGNMGEEEVIFDKNRKPKLP
jgi:hypothetical protein